MRLDVLQNSSIISSVNELLTIALIELLSLLFFGYGSIRIYRLNMSPVNTAITITFFLFFGINLLVLTWLSGSLWIAMAQLSYVAICMLAICGGPVLLAMCGLKSRE